jgi:hypothetical protein
MAEHRDDSPGGGVATHRYRRHSLSELDSCLSHTTIGISAIGHSALLPASSLRGLGSGCTLAASLTATATATAAAAAPATPSAAPAATSLSAGCSTRPFLAASTLTALAAAAAAATSTTSTSRPAVGLTPLGALGCSSGGARHVGGLGPLVGGVLHILHRLTLGWNGETDSKRSVRTSELTCRTPARVQRVSSLPDRCGTPGRVSGGASRGCCADRRAAGGAHAALPLGGNARHPGPLSARVNTPPKPAPE